MVSSQRTEDSYGRRPAPAAFRARPPTCRGPPRGPARGANRIARITENITYQTSRTVKKTRLPAGAIRKMSLAVLVDQDVTWEKDKNGFQRVLVPPPPEKLKVIRDLVAGITGFTPERGDQLVIETLPFETTLLLEPPQPSRRFAGAGAAAGGSPLPLVLKLDRKTLLIAGGAAAAAAGLLSSLVLLLRRAGRTRVRRRRPTPAALPRRRDAARRRGSLGRSRAADRIASWPSATRCSRSWKRRR